LGHLCIVLHQLPTLRGQSKFGVWPQVCCLSTKYKLGHPPVITNSENIDVSGILIPFIINISGYVIGGWGCPNV
jgi:hypothetical protein